MVADAETFDRLHAPARTLLIFSALSLPNLQAREVHTVSRFAVPSGSFSAHGIPPRSRQPAKLTATPLRAQGILGLVAALHVLCRKDSPKLVRARLGCAKASATVAAVLAALFVLACGVMAAVTITTGASCPHLRLDKKGQGSWWRTICMDPVGYGVLPLVYFAINAALLSSAIWVSVYISIGCLRTW